MFERQQQYQHQRKILNRRTKTIGSIENFSQTSEQKNISHNKSKFDCISNPFTHQQNQRQSVSLSNVSKISRISSQVNDIQKMKITYQNRINRQKTNKNHNNHNKSLDKSSLGKSVQKHTLKPTTTPNFNKIQNKIINTKRKQEEDISYSDINVKANQKNQQQQNEKSKKSSKYLITSAEKDQYPNCSEVSSKFEDYQFGYELGCYQKGNDYLNRSKHMPFKSQFKRSLTPTKINFSQIDQNKTMRQEQMIVEMNDRQKSNNQHKIDNRINCSCDDTLKGYIQQNNEKMASITQRLVYLQQQNQKFKIFQQKFYEKQRQTELLKQRINQIQNQNDHLKQSNMRYQNQKQQLQSILKDILFKRQRQKLKFINSKENTQRSIKKQKLEDFKHQSQQQQRRNIQPLLKKNLNTISNNKFSSQMKQNNYTDSKMKVQNLLEKLHIKVERS